jgi:tetratricopeptide (TPR) repeat protein
MRWAKFVTLLLFFALGCSRQTAQPSAASPEGDLAQNASEKGEVPAPQSRPANPQAEFGQRIARLSAVAAEHERRGYFDSAIASRQEIARLFAERSGPDAWETRSATQALERTRHLARFTPDERAKCDAAEGRERQAYQLWKQGRAQDAITALAEARVLSARVWGEDSFSVANMLDQQGRWQLAAGDIASAEALFRRALAVREKVFTRDHPDTIASMSAIALLLQSARRLDEAEAMLREATDRSRTVWGDDHPEYATHLNNLGMLLHEMGRGAEAVELLTRATTIRRGALGAQHVPVAQTLLNLGFVYCARQDYDQAEPCFREALTIFEPALGGGDPLTRKTRASLAIARMALRDFAEAEQLLRADLEWTRKQCGDDHPETAESLMRLAVLFGNQGRYDEALPLAERAATIHRAAAGSDKDRTQALDELVATIRDRLEKKKAAGMGSVAGKDSAEHAKASRPAGAAVAAPAMPIPAAASGGSAARTSFEQNSRR